MAGLVSAIHEATPFAKDVSNSEPRFIMDARVKPAHDPRGCGSPKTSTGKNRKYALRAMAKTTGPD
jgi:hypothetical protein